MSGIHVEDVSSQLPILYLIGNIQHEVDEIETSEQCWREVDVLYD